MRTELSNIFILRNKYFAINVQFSGFFKKNHITPCKARKQRRYKGVTEREGIRRKKETLKEREK